jgi:hypothetical protein
VRRIDQVVMTRGFSWLECRRTLSVNLPI